MWESHQPSSCPFFLFLILCDVSSGESAAGFSASRRDCGPHDPRVVAALGASSPPPTASPLPETLPANVLAWPAPHLLHHSHLDAPSPAFLEIQTRGAYLKMKEAFILAHLVQLLGSFFFFLYKAFQLFSDMKLCMRSAEEMKAAQLRSHQRPFFWYRFVSEPLSFT